MKTTFKLSALAIVILLSSCASSDIAVLKRRYNTGYYVDLNHKKTETSKIYSSVKSTENRSTVSKQKKENSDEGTVVVANQPEINYPLTAGTDDKINITAVSKAVKFGSASSSIAPSNEQSPAPRCDSKFKKRIVPKITSKINNLKPAAADDSKLILLVILSLFPILALIAVYIKDGNRITNNFWIDLILHLTFIGYAIFALLVVLDIISLA